MSRCQALPCCWGMHCPAKASSHPGRWLLLSWGLCCLSCSGAVLMLLKEGDSFWCLLQGGEASEFAGWMPRCRDSLSGACRGAGRLLLAPALLCPRGLRCPQPSCTADGPLQEAGGALLSLGWGWLLVPWLFGVEVELDDVQECSPGCVSSQPCCEHSSELSLEGRSSGVAKRALNEAGQETLGWRSELCPALCSPPRRRRFLNASSKRGQRRSPSLVSLSLRSLCLRVAVIYPVQSWKSPVLDIPHLCWAASGLCHPTEGSNVLHHLSVPSLNLPSLSVHFEKVSPGSQCPSCSLWLLLFCSAGPPLTPSSLLSRGAGQWPGSGFKPCLCSSSCSHCPAWL